MYVTNVIDSDAIRQQDHWPCV